jgi:hypothetical protein
MPQGSAGLGSLESSSGTGSNIWTVDGLPRETREPGCGGVAPAGIDAPVVKNQRGLAADVVKINGVHHPLCKPRIQRSNLRVDVD